MDAASGFGVTPKQYPEMPPQKPQQASVNISASNIDDPLLPSKEHLQSSSTPSDKSLDEHIVTLPVHGKKMHLPENNASEHGKSKKQLVTHLETYDFVYRLESKEAFQYLVLGEQPLSTLFPQRTPEQRPAFIKPTWWQAFEKAVTLHKAGYSLKDVQTQKACRTTKEWLKTRSRMLICLIFL